MKTKASTQRTITGQPLTHRLLTTLLTKVGPCVRMQKKPRQLFARAHQLFFLNRSGGISTLVLENLGMLSFHPYKLSDQRNFFCSRRHLDEFLEACDVDGTMDQECMGSNKEQVLALLQLARERLAILLHPDIPPCCPLQPHNNEEIGAHLFRNRFSAAWVYTRTIFHGMSVLEQQQCEQFISQRHEVVLEIVRDLLSRPWLCPSRRGSWWDRLTVTLHTHLKRNKQAIAACEEALEDAWTRGGERLSIQRRLKRLLVQRGSVVPRQLADCDWDPPVLAIAAHHMQNCRFVGYDDEIVRVEELVLQHFGQPEHGAWGGVHTEGRLWRTLFGLLFWDIVFDDCVPGVFVTPHQRAPLDLGTDAFYAQRVKSITLQLDTIRGWSPQQVSDAILLSWCHNAGRACCGVNWDDDTLPPHTIAKVASWVGGPALAHLCHLLASDYDSWSAGMPDLVLWRDTSDDTQAGGEVMVLEVKSAQDQLRNNQRVWLREMRAAGLDARVLRVQSKRPRISA
eukprot:c7277_g1_i2.p1 GENE.c7277_g1_i2~~c7277_g1_i2.p1  ORF type:complete len:510 (-),score=109.92 c7277_g1_i2:89-1618(-)